MMRVHCFATSLIAGVALLAASVLANAATLGTPVLESGLGESLRIVLPVLPGGRDRLTMDCVKLRAGGELNDISDSVRADIVTTGERQALVLTTVRQVNELVISVGVSLECGAFFLRRYTFLLDLPVVERPGAAASAAAQPLPAQVNVQVPVAASATAPLPPAPAVARGTRSAKRAAAVRPEDEPGVLPRPRRSAQMPRATRAIRPPIALIAPIPIAPPVRSMLKIELGGLNEFLASQPRLNLEQTTGMRLATDISAPDRQSAAAIAADRGFRQAHARYLAAMRDAPDPVTTENVALGKRLDAFSKDLASLKLDLQTTRARADALEASRVPWWWLLIAATLAALAAGGAAAWWQRRVERRPAGRLIDVDAPFPVRAAAPYGGPGQEAMQARDITATVVMTRAEHARRVARGEPDPAPVAVANPVPAAALQEATPSAQAELELPSDSRDDLLSFDLPSFDQAATPSPVAGQAITAASSAIAAAVATTAAPRPLDKNSLTQQLAGLHDLSDEAWASYRHASDPGGVALPFGTGVDAAASTVTASAAPVVAQAAPQDGPGSQAASGGGPALAMEDLQIDFSLDLEPNPLSHTATEATPAAPAAPARQAGLISTADISAMFEPAAQNGVPHGEPQVTAHAPLSAATQQNDEPAFALETLDLPATLTGAATARGIRLAALEPSAPDALESEKMRAVMAAASEVMEAAHKLMQEGHAGGALRSLGAYIESAPSQAPPGPWVQLAHTLHEVGMRREYVEAQALFNERFGASLPGWDAAYELRRHQMGLARVPGIEIVVAAGRGKPELIGRLAGLAYRVAVPPEMLFDVLLHRELLQQAAHTQAASLDTAGAGGDQVDFSL